MGLHPKYETPKQLQAAIDNYFDENESYTICGLALALGFVSRQSLSDYAEKPEFTDIIKKSKLRVEQYYESNLLGKNVAGACFALKNMGWSDKQEITHDIKNELPINLTIVRNGIK